MCETRKGANIMDKDIFVEVVGKIREESGPAGLDVVINVTTSGSKFSYEQRMSHLELVKPEMCSYDPGTMNWANSYVFLNEPKFLEELGTLTQELDIKPEIEIFDAGMIGNVNHYLKKGFLRPRSIVSWCSAFPAACPAPRSPVAYLIPSSRPRVLLVDLRASARTTWPACSWASPEGGAVRVGLEDNIFYEKGVLGHQPAACERRCDRSQARHRDRQRGERRGRFWASSSDRSERPARQAKGMAKDNGST